MTITPSDTAAAPADDATLADWLDWQLNLHTADIALGLERVGQVARQLGVLPFAGRCVVVAGTNGKGSCVCLIEALLRTRGYSVGAYTSPHLWRYNERVRVDASDAADADLCAAFAAVEAARGDVPLTFFEFGTLAALWLFQRANVDYAVLEVGLGGRLDAVNIVDADVAVITNIGLDHSAWLGDTRAAIGLEKAGVMRAGRPVVCADRDLPQSVSAHAEAVGAHMHRLGDTFDIDGIDWHGWSNQHVTLPAPWPHGVLPQNLGAALAVAALLHELPQTAADVTRMAHAQQTLHGRCEVLADGRVTEIYDVAHNAEAMAVLVAFLRAHPVAGTTHVVIGMLADKPVEAVAGLLGEQADRLYAADLSAVSSRGLDAHTLAARIGDDAHVSGAPGDALMAARAAAQTGDRIVVCGSFFTVAQARMV